MVVTPVKCQHRGNGKVKKNGTSKDGKQRLLCGNEKCSHKTLLKPCDIKVVYADNNDAYQSQGTHRELVMDKEKIQRIERKQRSLRTWRSGLVRKGIRFSKDHGMHQIVVALLINFWFF
ncbi:hypothetical protein Holit_03264 [Hollandina sp. SP2]